MGRPIKYDGGRTTVTFSLSHELLDRINAQCEKLGVNRSVFVVGAVDWLVTQLEERKDGMKDGKD